MCCDYDLGHVILSCTLSYVESPKKRKRKRKINNDLAVLPSYNRTLQRNIGLFFFIFGLD